MKTFYNDLAQPVKDGQKRCKGLFRLFTLLIMCLVTGGAMAQQQVEFSNKVDSSNDRWSTKTLNGITVTYPGASKDNGYNQLTSNQVLKITSEPGINIVSVTVTKRVDSSSTLEAGPFETVNTENNGLTSTSFSSNSVEITNTSGKNYNISKVVVTYTSNGGSTVAPTNCTVTSDVLEIGVNQEFTLTAVADGTTPSYKWFKNGSEILGATNATYTASEASAGVYAYYCVASNTAGEKKSNEVTVTVNNVKQNVTLTATALTLTEGETGKSTITSNPVIDNIAYTYNSDNKNVATVAADGTVTAVSEGTAVVTVKYAGNNEYNAAETAFNVTVNKKQVVTEPIFTVHEEDANGNEIKVEIEDLDDTPYDGEKLRLRFALPEGLADAADCVVRYVMVRDGENSGSSTPTTVYDGKYILLTSTTFVTAVIYNKKTKKEVGQRVTKTIRFNFTLLRAFGAESNNLTNGDQRNITTSDKTRTYVIATFGSKDDKNNVNIWGDVKVDDDAQLRGTEISGFNYVSMGQKDAMGEDGSQFDGNTLYSPFKIEEGQPAPEYYQKMSTENGTFKIPVSGAYIKFEPKMGGTINVILRQNGIIANFDQPKTEVMRKRHIYVCDEEGKVLTDVRAFINANSKMNEQIFTFGATDNSFQDTPETDANPQTVAQSEENFKLYRNLVYRAGHLDCTLGEDGLTLTDAGGNVISDDVTKAYWRGEAKNEVTHNILYKDGNGWITLSKAYVRYSFDVKPGKTYFIMGQITKVGVCGYSFKRLIKDDSQWGEIVDGRNITIDEKETELPASLAPDATGISGCNVTLTRSFDRGVWTTLLLPFNVSPSTLQEAFGEGTEILHFGQVEGSKLNLVKHYHQMIVAGTPVLIRPAGNFADGKITNPVFKNIGYNGYVPIKEMTGGDWKITGSYLPKEMPANSYYVGYKADGTGNNVYLSTKGRKMNGTRAWFEYTGSDPAAAKITGLSVSGIEDGEATGIGSVIPEMDNVFATNSKVYNLNGQMISNKGMEGLAKGIYIMGGKKIIVK